jgi:hypothetical protein
MTGCSSEDCKSGCGGRSFTSALITADFRMLRVFRRTVLTLRAAGYSESDFQK